MAPAPLKVQGTENLDTTERTPMSGPLRITDTTFRDAHQSLLATRLRLRDMEPLASAMDQVGFHSMEVWGGATFDVATRFLAEDPWERVRRLKQLMPHTPLQMLLRGQNLVGYRNYADDVVRAFVAHAAEVGIDIFRIFDALNDERNLRTAMEAVKATGKHTQACICYSLTEERMGGPVYTLDYFLQKAATLQEMGADSLCIKDMAGLLSPYDAYELVTALKQRLHIPLQLHCHYTSGLASMACLKAAEASVDVVDACLAPLALRTSQPAVEPLVVALQGTERDTGLDLERLILLGQELEQVVPRYRQFLDQSRAAVVDAGVLSHQIPGGMASNLAAQLREAGAEDRLSEVLAELPRVRRELGYPPLVTPTSQIVGTQAVSNILFGRYQMISAQVKDYLFGLYGRSPTPPDPEVVKKALEGYPRGDQPITVRPADLLTPELDKARESVKEISTDLGDVLIYALYPVTGLQFLKWKHGLEPVPEEVQRVGMEVPEAKPATTMAPSTPKARAAGTRLFTVYVDGERFQVEVEPVGGAPAKGIPAPTLSRPAAPRPPASPQPTPAPGASRRPDLPPGTPVTAPLPGTLVRYTVTVGQKVSAGETVVLLEAMKMENALPSPVDGVVAALPYQSGAKVARGDVLAIIGTAEG